MRLLATILLLTMCIFSNAQNSLVGDGFGGRSWYTPTNYGVGSYSAYSVCHDSCGAVDNVMYGWGVNYRNQIGLGPNVIGVDTPTAIPNMTNVRYASSGYITGAIKNDNTGWAFGNGIAGNPIQVITDVRFVSSSAAIISFVKNDGTVWSIGNNQRGVFGNGTTGTISDSIPIQMQNMTNAVRVTNNLSSTTILLSDSSVMVAGTDTFATGCLGNGSSITLALTPIPIPGLPKIVDIKSNALGTIALAANGDVYFWGQDVNYLSHFLPVQLPSLSNIVAISGCDDGGHFMALDENKKCYAWGDNGGGQCGIPTLFSNFKILTPTLVDSNVIDIMAGETFSYIVKDDWTLWCAGASNGSSSSIWLNLPNTLRDTFTLLNPGIVPSACEIASITAHTIDCEGSITSGTITISNAGGQAPYTYSIGGPFQSSNVFTGLTAGTYQITVKDANGCLYTSSATIYGENCPPVGISEADKSKNIHIYPNPSSSYIYIEGVNELYDLTIYDALGRILHQESNVEESFKKVTTKNMSTGLLFIRIEHEGSITVSKLIKD